MSGGRLEGQRFRWQKLFSSVEDAQELYRSEMSLAYPVLRVLYSYGYRSRDAIETFLFTPSIAHVHEARFFKHMNVAVDRLVQVLHNHEKILIVGDYDVDGITATSLVLRSLLELGASVNFFIPNRFVDGYGISEKIVDRAAQNGYRVILTVDNGITATAAAVRARECGIDLIITDHHTPHGPLPDVFALINPKQEDCAYPGKDLAGVGVAYKLMAQLYAVLGKPLPESVYELLALGTIADVVPLQGENRSLVRYALQAIRNRESLALTMLKANARIDRILTAQDIGFFIAPQLNALGRLEDARDGVFFLLGDEPDTAQRIGRRLYELNQRRKDQERLVLADVQHQIATGTIALDRDYACIALGNTWPAGVIGLAAARISQLYGRPAFLLQRSGDCFKGSCRSVPGINIFDLLSSVSHTLLHFGGHCAAAGLSVHADQLAEFKESVQNKLEQSYVLADLVPSIVCAAPLFLDEITSKLARDLALMEPFGAGNERPIFYIAHVQLVGELQLLKDEHVKCSITDRGVIKPVIFFNRPELYDWLSQRKNADFDVAAYVQENTYRGRTSIDLQGVDIRVSGESI